MRRPYLSTLTLLGALLACGPMPEISPPDLDPPPPEPLTDGEAAALGGLLVVARAAAAQPAGAVGALVSAVVRSRASCDEAIRGITRADLWEILRCASDPAKVELLLLRARPDLEPEILDCARALRDEAGLALDPGPGDPEAAGGIAAVPADRALLGALELRRDHGAASIVGADPGLPSRAAFVRFGGRQ